MYLAKSFLKLRCRVSTFQNDATTISQAVADGSSPAKLQMDDLEVLEVVAKVGSELQNHLGVSDKTLAEFIIANHSSDFKAFSSWIDSLGADLPKSLVESVDRIILTLHPKYKRSKAAQTNEYVNREDEKSRKSRIFKGLAIPDKEVKFDEEGNDSGLLDDTFAQLESLAPKENGSGTKHRHSKQQSPPPPRRYNDRNAGRNGKPYQREPSPPRRDRYPDRGRDTGRSWDQDRRQDRNARDRPWEPRNPSPYGGNNRANYGQRKRSASPPGGNGYGNKRQQFSAPAKPKKRLTSPERWEIKQLIASGALSRDQYPDIDEDPDGNGQMRNFDDDEEQEIDIEVKDEEPPFLAGQTKLSLELSPIRVVKAPDGSLNRAAMTGVTLAQERRDLRQQESQDKAAEQAVKVDLSAQWNDPMASGDKKFASELRGRGANGEAEAMPEWKRISQNKERALGKRTDLPMKEQREGLPVFKLRSLLLKAIKENQILIVVGDTGSGKTTQLTQYLAEDGYGNGGMIGCTQPRRVAAVSVAKRVSEEVGCQLGNEVGYTIRFEDVTSPSTMIKYMTDGILQREILLDPELKKYNVIMLDEAHERTVATDVLFGLLKKTLKIRSDLKLIVTSATLDADKFSEYFYKCPIFTIPGRTYPVEIMYSREPESDYVDAALVTVLQIHLSEPAGDILLFLT
jgi:hypothetical protein